MKLSANDIKKIAFGAVRIEEREDGMHFFKCTEKQIAAWTALSEALGARAETTTGIRLDFHTNSKALTFEASGNFEVYINDLYRDKLDMDELGGKATIALNDPLGDELEDIRVTLIFPSHAVGVLKSVELDDGAYVKPPRIRHENSLYRRLHHPRLGLGLQFPFLRMESHSLLQRGKHYTQRGRRLFPRIYF